MMEIAKGAEAEIRKTGNAAEKLRIKKGYRNKILDKILRKRRTQAEARLISEARRAGVKTPVLLEQGEFSIKMEYIDGKKIKDILSKENAARLCHLIGESVAKLHDNGIIHGDLTTSNMILKDGEMYFIDFGLGFRSQRAEDKASDLYLLHEALESTHFGIIEEAWRTILKVYRKKGKDGNKVLKALEKIEKRRRYAKSVMIGG